MTVVIEGAPVSSTEHARVGQAGGCFISNRIWAPSFRPVPPPHAPPAPVSCLSPSPDRHFASSSKLQPPPQLSLEGERAFAATTPLLREGVFLLMCGPRVLGRFLPPEVMVRTRSRLHGRLLGGSGRGKRDAACERGEGCLQFGDGVMGPESRELALLTV